MKKKNKKYKIWEDLKELLDDKSTQVFLDETKPFYYFTTRQHLMAFIKFLKYIKKPK